MKTHCLQAGPARNARGMTLIELMTTTALFTLTVAGLVAVNMFGLKQDEFLNSQIGASDQSRMEFNMLLRWKSGLLWQERPDRHGLEHELHPHHLQRRAAG